MVLQAITDFIKLYQDGREITPRITETSYSDVIATSFNEIDIAASATNQAIPLSSKGTIKRLRLTTDYESTAALTCKRDGNSEVYTINPIQEFTEEISSLTVSNSDTSAKTLRVEVLLGE